MPIRPFLNGEQFDEETLRILGVAFEQVCIGMRIGDCGDDVKRAIANKIIVRSLLGLLVSPQVIIERIV
jgi:hypothetical protein